MPCKQPAASSTLASSTKRAVLRQGRWTPNPANGDRHLGSPQRNGGRVWLIAAVSKTVVPRHRRFKSFPFLRWFDLYYPPCRARLLSNNANINVNGWPLGEGSGSPRTARVSDAGQSSIWMSITSSRARRARGCRRERGRQSGHGGKTEGSQSWRSARCSAASAM